MLLVPRTQHTYLGVGVNALGYIGALLARGDEVMGAIKTAGPMTVLRGVGVPQEL
jgi:ATP adenylyltransferase/5',5'''-P-1,P-4-tetraphosphate phosphorylase II